MGTERAEEVKDEEEPGSCGDPAWVIPGGPDDDEMERLFQDWLAWADEGLPW